MYDVREINIRPVFFSGCDALVLRYTDFIDQKINTKEGIANVRPKENPISVLI